MPEHQQQRWQDLHGKLMKHCNKWLRWAFVEAAWVAMGCSPYFGDLYKKKRAAGKKANTAILCVARRMARIAWQILTQERDYETLPPAPKPKSQPAAEERPPAKPAKQYVLSARAEKGKRRGPTAKQISPAAPIAR